MLFRLLFRLCRDGDQLCGVNIQLAGCIGISPDLQCHSARIGGHLYRDLCLAAAVCRMLAERLRDPLAAAVLRIRVPVLA